MSDGPTKAAASFPSTHWSAVATAAGDGAEACQALGELLTRYRAPLVGYLVSHFSLTEDQAQDCFQGFVEAVVLRRALLAQARPGKGHQFRSYLLSALHHFATDEFRRRSSRKRQPPGGLVSLEESPEAETRWQTTPAPEQFDVAWARGVVAEAVRRLRAECEASQRAALWGVFEARVLQPALEGTELEPYDQLVARFGLESPSQAHNLLVTAKRALDRHLRGVVGEYAAPEAVETELRELQIILSFADG